jgi:hypothetical protein
VFSLAPFLLASFFSTAAVLPCVAQSPRTPPGSQEADWHPKYSAKLVVQADDHALKNQVTSFLSRGLRSLDYITIVDEKGDNLLGSPRVINYGNG